jgi:hypothetical protein
MSRYGSQYQVSRPTGVCAESGDVLEPGSTCVATLCEQPEGEGFERLDYSVAAWDGGARPERLFSFWRTTVASPETRRRVFVDDEVLSDLFDRLADDERPQRIAFRFVLALILMRKRILKFAGRTPGEDGAPERWLMRRRGSDENDPPAEVVNPSLSDDDVRELTAQLGEILQSDFE